MNLEKRRQNTENHYQNQGKTKVELSENFSFCSDKDGVGFGINVRSADNFTFIIDLVLANLAKFLHFYSGTMIELLKAEK
ncbi:MAG TPA: hypothetical protein PK595_07220 [Bacteroidota bacterium]|nr:hypothetical protein [Bacteroidota bacterium]